MERWQRQDGESSQAWEAFTTYRDMPADERSYQAVAAQLQKSGSLIERWGTENHWQDRLRAYQNHLDREWLTTLAHERRLAVERQLGAAQDLHAKALAEIMDLPADSRAEAARLLALAAKLEREAFNLGQETKYVDPPDEIDRAFDRQNRELMAALAGL